MNTFSEVMKRLIMRELERRERALQDADIKDQIERVLAVGNLSRMAGGAEN